MTDNQNGPQNPGSWEQEVLQNVLMASIKEQKSSRRWGIFFKGAFLLYFIAVFYAMVAGDDKKGSSQSHTAIVNLMGEISVSGDASADAVAAGLREAFENKHSKAVVLNINSPGGSPVQSSYMYNEMMRLKALHPEKKLYAVIEDVGGSGGYFVASAADEIYANKSSIVGSIGVLMPNYGLTEVMKKIGVEQRTLTAGDNKLFLDPFSPENPNQKEFALKLLASVHTQFIDAVKAGRGARLKEDPSMFSGLFWTGEQALQLGLIDGYGSAGSVARDIVGEEEIVDYTTSQSLFERIARKTSTALSQGFRAGMQQSLVQF